MKDRLQNLYNEYITDKNKTRTFISHQLPQNRQVPHLDILNSSKQPSKKMLDQEAALESARRRFSNIQSTGDHSSREHIVEPSRNSFASQTSNKLNSSYFHNKKNSLSEQSEMPPRSSAGI